MKLRHFTIMWFNKSVKKNIMIILMPQWHHLFVAFEQFLLILQYITVVKARRSTNTSEDHTWSLWFSQFSLVHAAHQFLQFDGDRHVPFDPQFSRHERHRGLQFTWNKLKKLIDYSFHCHILFVWWSRCWRQTCKHLAEVTGVHWHDHISFDWWLSLSRRTRATLQVQKPNPSVFTWWRHDIVNMNDTTSGPP